MLSPVELPGINYDACNSSTMTTDPFSSRMYDDISTMLNGSNKVTSRTEGVVNLNDLIKPNWIDFSFPDAGSHH